MPVLESTDDKIAPKSILRHRPIDDAVFSTKKNATSKTTTVPVKQRASTGKDTTTKPAVVPVKQRASRVIAAGNVEEASERKHGAKITEEPRAAQQNASSSSATPAAKIASGLLRPPLHLAKHYKAEHRLTLKAHPLLYLGLGMVLMLTLWMVLSALLGWFTTTLDDIHYGRPRTYQVDAWVGHNEQTGMPSHFIAINLHKHIEIIEIAGGDPAHTRIYSGPELYGADDDLAPVTLSFVDVNGDHKPDMLITFRATRIVFINDHGGFRPLLPSERPQVEQFLQRWGQ